MENFPKIDGHLPGGLTKDEQKEEVGVDTRTAHEALFLYSSKVPEGTDTVRGIDFSKEHTLSSFIKSFHSNGFQATNLGLAIDRINEMIEYKSDEGEGCKIFLGYTSNMVSCGNREVIRYLVERKLVHCLVTTAGGIEEDFIKCMDPLYIGDFHLNGSTLRKNGLNRIGNLIIANNSYCKFEDWLNPILDEMVEAQKSEGTIWSPSSMIRLLGQKINNPDSIYYWAYKNDIPVFCPALTDGSIGDMIFFHSYKNPGLILDIASDIRGINSEAIHAKATGMIILGGGVSKHHICNANLMRNGADFSVFVNTGNEYEGSDSGASPDEAVSWGKIKATAKPVKVSCDASIAFPLIVAETFAKVGSK